jgi:hypothetical protein
MNPHILTLNQAFRDRSVSPEHCISENSSAYFLVEDDLAANICLFANLETISVEAIQQKYFSVKNPNQKNVQLWAIDGCFFPKSAARSRCDCALFTETEFCFVEFKLNATSSHPISIEDNRLKAVGQLKSTIEFVFGALKQANLWPLRVTFVAFVCTPPHFPSKDTSFSDERIEFLEELGVRLSESSEKTFL